MKARFAVATACLVSVSCLADVETDSAPESEALGTAEQAWAYTALRGQITFAPRYLKSSGSVVTTSLGQIPPSSDQAARFPHIFVCAIDRDNGFDNDPVYHPNDDDVLGCARADDTGYYNMALSGSGSDAGGGEVYLVTWFCDNADEPITVVGGAETFPDEAEVCVRMNTTSAAQSRKYLRSRETSLVVGSTNFLNWNLSCPNKAGVTNTVAEIECTSGEEEPTSSGNTNSLHDWNKEFAHVFRSAAELLKTYGSLKPTSANSASTGCGSLGSLACAPCNATGCTDEINLYITPADLPPASTECSTALSRNESALYDHVCIIDGVDGREGTLNPFRPVHEIGHNIHRRWMRDGSKIAQGCDAGVGWNTGDAESATTAEGFADFVAIMAWWNDDTGGYEYDGHDAVSRLDSDLGTCTSTTVVGEGRVAQWFVDLWDDDTDAMNLSFTDILRIWSTFDQTDENNECGPDGRNARDFRDAYNALRTTYGWPSVSTFDVIFSDNCMDRHSTDELGSDSDESTCGCP